MVKHNPFKYGQVVSGDDFCPRPALIKALTGNILAAQNTLLEGERRVGKTSLIVHACRKTKLPTQIYIDLLFIKSVEDLCKRIIKGILSSEKQAGLIQRVLKSLSHVKPSVSLDPLTGQPSFSFEQANRNLPESIEGLLDLVHSLSESGKVCVVIDEFQDILHIKGSDQVLALMRGKIQFHSDIPYVFAGSIRNDMADIFLNPKSPFFKSAIPLHVGSLDPETFTHFIMKKFASGKRKIPAPLIGQILCLVDNSPGDAQQCCAAMWDVSDPGAVLDAPRLKNALELIFHRELKGYEATMAGITAHQQKCLLALARNPALPPYSKAFLKTSGVALPASVARALKRLEALRILYRLEKRWKFINPFFRCWLVSQDL